MYPPKWLLHPPVLGSFASRIFRWIALRTQYRYSVVKRRGIFLLVDLDSIVGRHMYSRGFWEEKEIDFLMAEAQKA